MAKSQTVALVLLLLILLNLLKTTADPQIWKWLTVAFDASLASALPAYVGFLIGNILYGFWR
jgi:hypothetical protein